MDIGGEHLFDAPRDHVWNALRDPNVLAKVMPGGEGFEETGENQYVGLLNIKIGPIRGKFKGEIELKDLNEPETYTMVVDGKGAPGFVKATGHVKLEARGQQTLLQYSGKAQVGGKIASVGQRLMDTSARSIIRQSLEGLNAYLKQKMAFEAGLQPSGSTASTDAEAEAAVESAADVASKEAPVSDEGPAAVEATGADVTEAKDTKAATSAVAAEPAAAPTFQYQPPSQSELARKVAADVMGELIPAPLRIALLIGLGIGIGALACWLLR